MMDQGVFYRICRVDGMPQNCEVAARSPPLAAKQLPPNGEVVRWAEVMGCKREIEAAVGRQSSRHGGTAPGGASGSRSAEMATGDLLYLTFLFGLWLAVVASVTCASVRHE